MRVPDLSGLHRDIAADVWPKGGALYCRACGHSIPMTSEDAGRYLARGWPKHCGATMSLDKPESAA